MRYSKEWMEFCLAWANKGDTHPQEAWWKWVSVISGEPVGQLMEGSSKTFAPGSMVRDSTVFEGETRWSWRSNNTNTNKARVTENVCFDVKFADGTIHTYNTEEPL